ncbi:MAG: acetylornithine deacetylase [Alphaproteobacteria bacterium]
MAAVYSPVEMLDRLVAFDTTSRESNLELIHFVRDYLADHGVASDLIHDETGNKANLWATVGPVADGGIVLSGHTDVVPVDGQDWSSNPFEVRKANGKLFGRGTADMKGFIACALAAVPEMNKRQLNRPIHFALSYDEEVGCLGARGLVEHVEGLPVRPRAVIVGEPTDLSVVNAHKGSIGVHTTVHGLEGHSSKTHQGVNAIMYAAELIAELARMAEEYKAPAFQNERFDPPYSTINVGLIKGGTAPNIIPKQSRFTWECRAVPQMNPRDVFERFKTYCADEVVPRMRKVHPQADITHEIRAEVPGLLPDEGGSWESLMLALANSNQTYAVSYGTEAGLFQGVGVPAVVCGPGNIEQAHKPDEFVEESQIAECSQLIGRVLDHLEGK